jgi:hypothetical protein
VAKAEIRIKGIDKMKGRKVTDKKVEPSLFAARKVKMHIMMKSGKDEKVKRRISREKKEDRLVYMEREMVH